MFDSNVRNFVLHHRPSPPFLPRAQEFVGNRSYYLDKHAIPPALLAGLVEHLKQEGKVLWSQPLDHGSLLHVRDVDDDARDADDTDRSPLPWAAAPPIRTSGGGDLPVSAGVRDDSGIGDGGCLAYALDKLDTGITAGMLVLRAYMRARTTTAATRRSAVGCSRRRRRRCGGGGQWGGGAAAGRRRGGGGSGGGGGSVLVQFCL